MPTGPMRPRTTRTSHAPAEARLGEVTPPAPIIMGEADAGFGDQRAEAAWIAEALHGRVIMVPEAGPYSQSHRPDIATPAMVRFADTVNNRA